MAKISLNNITSGFNVNKINENFSKIVDHLQNKVLYRNNPVGEPNELVNDVDVNGKRLYNLPVPTLDNQAARLKDVKDALQGQTGLVPFPASLIPASDNAGGTLFNTVQGGLDYIRGLISNIYTSLSASTGSNLIGFIQSGANAVVRTVQSKLRESVSVEDWGASPSNTASVNYLAIQRCINESPEGTEILFPNRYLIDDELVVNKSLSFKGKKSGPFYIRASTGGLVQTITTKSIFKLTATQAMYAFGQYGIVGMKFKSLHLEGLANASRAVSAITTDTTVNSGDYHIRECTFEDLSIRWFTTGINLTGIAYLNNFNNNSVNYCDTAVKIARGSASDNGGQIRFFGGFYGLSRIGLSLNEDASSGSFGLHGVSVSENTEQGIRCHEEAMLYIAPDCEIESNTISGVYFEIKEANPTTTGSKLINGKFINNGVDIWVNKTTTAFAGGGFHWPMKIDNAFLGASNALRVDVPSGHAPIDSPAFIIGRNVSGPSGALAASQISSNFAGVDERKSFYAKRVVLPAGYVSGSIIAYLPPGLIVTSARMYFTANSTGSTGIQLGDQSNASRYLSGINAQSVALNTWQNGTLALPQDIIGSTNNLLRVTATAGWLSAQGVVEIQGYIS